MPYEKKSTKYNKFLQVENSPIAQSGDYKFDINNDIKIESSPFAPPTFISKGTINTTSGGILTLYDSTGGTKVLTYNPATAAITINGNINFNTGTITFSSFFRGLWPEVYYELVDASYFTGNTTYADAGPSGSQASRVNLASNEFGTANFDVYFEVIMTGDTNSGCQAQLYNYTTGSAITNTQLNTAGSITGGTPETIRSGTIALTAGTNTYGAQYRRTSAFGTGFPRIYGARVVMRLRGL